MGASKLAGELDCSKEEAQQFIDDFYRGFPKVKKWMDDTVKGCKENGYVEDFWGRRRRLPDIQLPEYTIKSKKDESFNPLLFSIQGKQIPEKTVKTILEELKKVWKNSDIKKIQEKYEKQGITILQNGGKISDAERQSVNARIQGCLSGDVKIQTKELGIVPIKDVVNRTMKIWDGSDWTAGTILPSGKKKKCVINFSDGSSITCSPNHKFLTILTNGHEMFKECQNLKSGDRLLLSRGYEPSDYVYNSDEFKITTKAHNAHQYYFDDVLTEHSRYDLGRVIGRLASDGYNCMRESGGNHIRQIVAENEKCVYDYLCDVMGVFNTNTSVARKAERYQPIYNIEVHSKTLVSEVKSLDIRHKIHKNIFMDTEVLRGFVSGYYDGNGGITGDKICLTFGKQDNFEPLAKDIQTALRFFGIRSRYKEYSGCYHLTILKADSKKFAEVVGFINDKKQNKSLNITTAHDNHTFDNKAFNIITTIDFTDEEIEMYDVCNTDRGYFVADGFITHNSAATMTKKAMVNIHKDEYLNSLDFHLLIGVHDRPSQLICRA